MKPKTNNYESEFLILVAIAMLVFQQSPANEMLRVYLGLSALQATANAFIVIAVVFFVTLVIEFVTGILVALALNKSTTGLARLKRRINKLLHINAKKKDKGFDLSTDILLSLAIGSVGVVMRRYYAQTKRTLSKDVQVIIKSSLFIAAFSCFIAAIASIGILYAASFGAFAPAAETLVSLLADWKTYVVLLVILQAIRHIKGKRNNHLD